VATLHSLYTFDKNLELFFNKKLEKDIIVKLVKNDVPITAVSSSIKELCLNNFQVRSDMINVIINGVDFEKFQSVEKSKTKLIAQYSLPQNKLIFLQVGTLSKRKNHIAVLNAFMNIDKNIRKNLLYLVVGTGEEITNLSNFVKVNELGKHVIFAGRISEEKLIDMYHLSDFFILPSTSEGLPLVFLEALAAGLPIITFDDLQGVKELYHPECMELIHGRSTKDIVEAIYRAMGRNWDKSRIKGHICSISWDSVAKKYIDCYEEIIDANRLH